MKVARAPTGRQRIQWAAEEGLEVRSGAVVEMGVYGKWVKAAHRCVCRGPLSSLIHVGNCGRLKLEKPYNLPTPTYRSELEWGLAFVVWLVRIDIVPCEQ